jgi:hypothetical protein
MYKLLIFAGAVSLQVMGAAEPVREVSYRGADLTPTNTRPTFDHGYLAVHDFKKINIYAPDGSFAFSFGSPRGGLIASVAVDTDGAVAAALGYVPSDRGPGFIVLDRTGAVKADVATGPYRPTQVCFAADHSIWTIGMVRTPETPDYFLLRHYAREGQELGAYLAHSSLKQTGDLQPAMYHVGGWNMQAAKDRIGAYLNYGNHEERVWIEVGLDGKELGRWKFPAGFHGAPSAFTQSGAVYSQAEEGLFLLDHSTGNWNPVPPPSDGRLLGADGDNLVFAIYAEGRLRYLPATQQ